MADKEGQPLSSGPNTILLIEDDDRVRSLTQYILQESGFQVQSASLGQEGLDLFRDNHADIVAALVDLSLPDMDGQVICRQLRQQRRYLPILVISGNPDPGLGPDFAPCLFLQKPFHITELLECIKKVINGGVVELRNGG